MNTFQNWWKEFVVDEVACQLNDLYRIMEEDDSYYTGAFDKAVKNVADRYQINPGEVYAYTT